MAADELTDVAVDPVLGSLGGVQEAPMTPEKGRCGLADAAEEIEGSLDDDDHRVGVVEAVGEERDDAVLVVRRDQNKRLDVERGVRHAPGGVADQVEAEAVLCVDAGAGPLGGAGFAVARKDVAVLVIPWGEKMAAQRG